MKKTEPSFLKKRIYRKKKIKQKGFTAFPFCSMSDRQLSLLIQKKEE
jgi:hypothetical protein